jgi:hypothetical protein
MAERLASWVAATVLVLPCGAWAAFQDTLAGARSLGLAGAGVATVRDTESLALNPAGLAWLPSMKGPDERAQQVQATYGGLYVGLSDETALTQSLLAYAIGSPGAGGLGIGWRRTQASSLYHEDRLAVGLSRRVRTGSEDAAGRLALGAAAELLRWDAAPTIGAAGNVVEDLAGPLRLGITLGAVYALSPNVPIGVVFHHVNRPDVSSSRSRERERLPVRTALGMGAVGGRALWAFDIAVERDNIDVHTGVEWEAQPRTLFLRAGFRLEGLALGANLTGGVGLHVTPSVRVDYAAWIPAGNVQETWGSHRVSVVYGF